MSCGDDLKTLLSRYVDGELSAPERATVEEHVTGCAPCRELLALFQKNESLLSNALSTEAFGNTIIESVVREIKGDTRLPEAKPVEEGVWESIRSRPLVRLAAAAVLVVGLFSLIFAQGRQMSALGRKLDDSQKHMQRLAASEREQAQMVAEQHDEYTQLIHKLRLEDAIRLASEKTISAFVEPTLPHQLLVRASFDLKTFKSFDLYRKNEGDPYDGFVKLTGKSRLDIPEYPDSTVKAGQAYCYKFRGYRDGSDVDAYVDSFPIVMRVPKSPQLPPEKSINIRCTDISASPNKKLALFTLERMVNGATVSEKFYVEIGQRIGDIRDVQGVGRVDFRTNLVLEKLDESMQALSVNITRPLFDKDGKQMFRRLDKDTFVPETVQVEEVLSTRPNLRATIRPLKPTPGQPQGEIWKGGWLQVRTQD